MKRKKDQGHVQQNLIPDTFNHETHALDLKPIRTTSRLSSSYNFLSLKEAVLPQGEKWNMVANFLDKLCMEK